MIFYAENKMKGWGDTNKTSSVGIPRSELRKDSAVENHVARDGGLALTTTVGFPKSRVPITSVIGSKSREFKENG